MSFFLQSPPEPLDSGRHDVSKVVFSKDRKD